MHVFAPLFAWFVVLLLAAPASAYVPTRSHAGREIAWARPHLVFSLVPPSPVFELSEAQIQDAVRAALAAWSGIAGETELSLALGPPARREARVARDRVNVIKFREGNWCPDDFQDRDQCYDRARRGQTRTYLGPSSEIVEADIEINAVQFQWTPETLRQVLAHEIGHALGLDHNCSAGPLDERHDHLGASLPACRGASRSLRSTLMFDDPSANVGPARDEREFLRAVYPQRRRLPQACQIGLVSGPAVLLALLVVAQLRRRSRSA